MADVRMTPEQARAAARINPKLTASLSDNDLRHQLEADQGADFDPATLPPSPRFVREKLRLTQDQIAAAIGVPVTTWRNWEQGRFKLEAAVVALLRILEAEPEVALKALRRVA